MISLKDYDLTEENDKKAVVLCDGQRILECLSYKNLHQICTTIINTLSSIILDKHQCIALLMVHNIYIPAIVISLQKLDHAFIFLNESSCNKTIESLNVKWIFSLSEKCSINLLYVKKKVTLDDRNELFIWERVLRSSQDDNFKDIFCVMQTSGTTGEKKIIKITTTSIIINVHSIRNAFDITEEDLIYFGTPLTFDPSLIELLLSLLSRACLIIVAQCTRTNPNELFKALFLVQNITFLQIVPTVFFRWSDNQIKCILNKLRTLAFGGENFPNGILRFKRNKQLKIFNLYGITEVSCWASLHEIKEESFLDNIPIGNPLHDTVIEVRDELGRAIQSGIGEIYIGSASRICYVDGETSDLNLPKFRATGDLAIKNDEGIFYIGRTNNCIKRYGHRVSLENIEKKVFAETGLTSKCVWLTSKRKLLLFIQIVKFNIDDRAKVIDKIRVKLLHLVRKEEFPDFLEILLEFPLNGHGKIDTKQLESLYTAQMIEKSNGKNLEDTFIMLWSKYLPAMNLKDNENYTFLEMGGNSVLMMQLLAELNEKLNADYSSELLSLLFTESFKGCLQKLDKIESAINIRKRRTELPICDDSNKKIKNEVSLTVVWIYNMEACVDCPPLSFNSWVNKQNCVAVGSFSHIFAVISGDGKEIMKHVLPDAIESKPTISSCGKYLIVCCIDGSVYCFDFYLKNVIWKYTTGNQIKCPASLCKDNAAIVFGSYDKYIHCILLKDGRPLWKTDVLESTISKPLCIKSRIFVSTILGTCICLSEDTGDLIWSYKALNPIFSSPCFADSNRTVIYADVKGILHCLSLEGKLLWKFAASGSVFSSLLNYKEKILFGCHDKHLYVLESMSSSCKLIAKVLLDSAISTAPSFLNDGRIVVVCNSGIVYVVDLDRHVILGSLKLPGEVFSSPCVHKNKIFIGCRDNNLYCLEINS